MRILVIGTVDGQKNEGMRNIITHLASSMEQLQHHVEYSRLRTVPTTLAKSIKADAILVCSRATCMSYFLIMLLKLVYTNKPIFFLVVQPPRNGFIKLCRMRELKCHYLCINIDDMLDISTAGGSKIDEIKVGIDTTKFRPVSMAERASIKYRWGFDLSRPIVLHVGHRSKGRGLEKICTLDEQKYQRVVVASGLFEDEETVRMLERSQVRNIVGYIDSIEELYQIADVYIFPTVDKDYVISIPLSVMEALACGTPVVAFRQFDPTRRIAATNKKKAITLIESESQLNRAVNDALSTKECVSLLKTDLSWNEVALSVLAIMEGYLEQ